MFPATFCMVAVVAAADPAPFTEEQRDRISKLANETKKEADRLKALLDEKQRELAEVYDKYALDEDKATNIEAAVLVLQKQMLANHRKMQVELRTLVTQERFVLLRRRLENMLKTPSAKTPEKEARPAERQ